MAAYDLEEQEQIAELKVWWKLYGNRLVNAATVIALVVDCVAGMELVSA